MFGGLFLWVVFLSETIGSVSVSVSRFAHPPRKTHVAHVLLISASPRPKGAQFRVSTGRNTWYAKP